MRFAVALTATLAAVLSSALAAPADISARAPTPILAARAGAPTFGPVHPNGDQSKCLDVQSAKFANGTAVQVYDCNGTPAQQWQVYSDAGHPVTISDNNGGFYCLDAGRKPFVDHDPVHIWQCHPEGTSDAAQQTWYYNTVSNDDHLSLYQQDGWCMRFDSTQVNHDTFTGGYVGISKCNGNDQNQKWTL